MKIVLIGFVLMLGMTLYAQTSKELQYGGYLTNSKSLWERSVASAEKKFGAISFEKAMALYGLLNSTMATEDEETFDKYKDETIDLLKVLIDKEPSNGEVLAVLSSIYGLVMAYSPMKGMLYGSKSASLMSDALQKEPDSPLVQKLYAGSKLYTPTMWGGSPTKAVKAFQKSIMLYEKESVSNDWLYLDALVGLALSYQKIGDKEAAKQTLDKAIKQEPQYRWAQSILVKLDDEE